MNRMMKWMVALACLCAGILCGAQEKSTAKQLLIVGSENYAERYKAALAPQGYTFSTILQDNGAKDWKEKGYLLPGAEQLKKYSLIIISPLAYLTAASKKDLVQYVNNGGCVFFLYNSLAITREKSGELGFGICGFDSIQPVMLKPYPGAGPMLHKLEYTKKLGTKKMEKKLLYTVYAKDLVNAEALVINPEKPDLAFATIASVGKGQFIFYGGEDLGIILDILNIAGF